MLHFFAEIWCVAINYIWLKIECIEAISNDFCKTVKNYQFSENHFENWLKLPVKTLDKLFHICTLGHADSQRCTTNHLQGTRYCIVQHVNLGTIHWGQLAYQILRALVDCRNEVVEDSGGKGRIDRFALALPQSFWKFQTLQFPWINA